MKAGKQKKADAAQVQLLLEDGSIYAEKGRLQFTDLAVDPSSGAVVLRAEFPNPRRELLPGTFVRVRFPQAQLDDAIRVPAARGAEQPAGPDGDDGRCRRQGGAAPGQDGRHVRR